MGNKKVAFNELGKYSLHLFIKNMALCFIYKYKRFGLPGGRNLKRSQLPLCEGSVIGRPLIEGKYEWSDVGETLLKVAIEFYFLVQRLK